MNNNINKKIMRYPALGKWLDDRGTSLVWLSAKTGIEYQRLYRVLHFMGTPVDSELNKICKATNMTIDELKNNEIEIIYRKKRGIKNGNTKRTSN